MSSGDTEPSPDGGATEVIQTEKRHSSDIITAATSIKNEGNIGAAVAKHEAQQPPSKGCCGGGRSSEEEARRLQQLKGELDMDEHEVGIEELCERLGLSENNALPLNWTETGSAKPEWSVDTANIKGLTTNQVLAAREEYGLNQLTPPKKTPEIIIFLTHLFGDFFSLLLWGGSVLCFVAYGVKLERDNMYLGIVLALVVTFTGIFGYFQEKKSSDLMESFKNMMPQETIVIRTDSETGTTGSKSLNAVELVPGDIIKVKYGNKIPADIRVIECSDNFNVDNSSLTGESEPQRRSPKCTDENPLETQNLCFFGTECPEGQAHGMVVRTGDNTVMGRIASLTSSLKDDTDSPIKTEVNNFVLIISLIAIFLGVSFLIIGFARGTEPTQNFVFMIGIIVANVPEGLILTVLVCLSLTAQRMFNSSVLVKDLEGVETLGSTTCICSDKTGTLTQNIMTVQKVCYDNTRYSAMNMGSGDPEIDTSTQTFIAFLRCAVVCNTAEFDESSKYQKKIVNGLKVIDRNLPIPFSRTVEVGGQVEERVIWKTNGDATESALIKFAQKYVDVDDYRGDFKEVSKIPFNSTNKFMVTISEYPQEKQQEHEDSAFLLTMKGAPERVINRCSHVMIDGQVREMTAEYLQRIEQLQNQCSKEGLRVLGFAEKALPRADYPEDYKFITENPNFPMGADLSDAGSKTVEPDPRSAEKLVFLGLYALIDPPRPQVRPAVAKCKTAGIRVIMVTGDHPITAKAIARQVGIIWGDAARGGDAHGPATQEDYEEWNASKGLSPDNRVNEEGDVYFDPRLAPAIVVPGWEILPDDCHLGHAAPDRDPKTDVTVVPKEKWDDILGHTQIVFARTSPQQKLIIVENCKERGEIVAVTGDGVNDAPALRKAHIGIAMGIMGSDVSKEAADMILLDDNFASIVQGVEEGRLIFDNLKKSIAYTLSSNIPEIAPFLCFITARIPLPLSTVLILFVDLGTDMIPAISMAWENAESDIMRRPPRNADKDHLVTSKLIFFAYLQIGVIQALAGFFTYIVVLGDYGFPAKILPTTGFYWQLHTLWCKTKGGYFVTQDFDPTDFDRHDGNLKARRDWDPQFPIWWEGHDGEVVECTYPAQDVRGNADGYDRANPDNKECYDLYAEARKGNKNAGVSPDWFFPWEQDNPPKPTVADCWDSANPVSYYNDRGEIFTSNTWVSSYQAQDFLLKKGFRPYIPFKSRQSVFFSNQWLMADLYGSEYGSNQQTVPGLGMPKFKTQYADFLRKEGRTKEYEAWNVDLDLGTTPVESVIYFQYQPLGKYDIAAYSTKIGDVHYPIDSVATTFDGDKAAPTYDPTFNGPTNPINILPLTEKYYLDECQAAPSNENVVCDKLVHKGFGNANFTFAKMEYDYKNEKIIPSFDTTADFREDCKMAKGDTPQSRCDANEAGLKFNVMSRMLQREALAHAQTAYFVAIVIVQWADLMICKTRMNSIRQQGMLNSFMNFGLVFETILASLLCYLPVVNIGVGTRPIRMTHWLPAVPFSLWIFGYDEIRKWIMRSTTATKENKLTGQVERDAGWMERNTYY